MGDVPDIVAEKAHKGVICSVAAVVRIRPFLSKETAENSKQCVYQVANNPRQLLLGKKKAFTFDDVYPMEASNALVFKSCVSPLLDNFFDGYNATVFAYGQTGSGKTYTMGSLAIAPGGDYLNAGVIPAVAYMLFERIKASKSKEYSIRMSFLEIYQEDVRDLLDPVTKTINIRENADGDIVLAGVKEVEVVALDDLIRVFNQGSLSRTTGSTNMNEFSSRSHAVLSITLHQQIKNKGTTEYYSSKFNLVDLAGSERNRKTGVSGLRFKESITINTGLLALGNVISALGDEEHKAKHVPYRDSKITRLLQDSLGGNARTVMIACVSPADVNLDETLNTLRYADRARHIKNKPIVNRADPGQSKVVASLRAEVSRLKQELQQAPSLSETPLHDRIKELEQEKTLLNQEIQNIRQTNMTELEESNALTERYRVHIEQGRRMLSNILSNLPDLLDIVNEDIKNELIQRISRSLHRVIDEHDRVLLQGPVGAMLIETTEVALPDDDVQIGHQTLNVGPSDRPQSRPQTAAEIEVETLRSQLQAAQEDLEHDEIIFKEQLNEIQVLKRRLEKERSESQGRIHNILTHPRMPTVTEVDEVLYDDDKVVVEPATPTTCAPVAINLEAERKALESEREALDSERLRLEETTRQQIRALQLQQKNTDKTLKSLEINIRLKEQLIKELVSNERKAVRSKNEADQRVGVLESELTKLKTELDKRALEGRCDETLRQYDNEALMLQMNVIRKQISDVKNNGHSPSKLSAMTRMHQLEKEIDAMKEVYQELNVKAHNGQEVLANLKKSHEDEVIQLKQELENRDNKIIELEQQINNIQAESMVVDEADEPVIVALPDDEEVIDNDVSQDKLNDTFDLSVTMERDRSVITDLLMNDDINENIVADIEAYIEERSKQEDAQREEAMRVKYVAERNRLITERSSLNNTRDSIKCDVDIGDLRDKLNALQQKFDTAPGDNEQVKAEISMLQERIQILTVQQSQLRSETGGQLPRDKSLMSLYYATNEEMEQIDDRIEELDIQIDYASDRLREIRPFADRPKTSAGVDQGSAVPFYRPSTAPQPRSFEDGDLVKSIKLHSQNIIDQHRHVIYRLHRARVELESQKKRLEDDLQEKELLLTQARTAVTMTTMECKTALQMAAMEAERQLAEVEERNEHKLRSIQSEMESMRARYDDELKTTEAKYRRNTEQRERRMQGLEHDVFVHKQNERELQQMVKSMTNEMSSMTNNTRSPHPISSRDQSPFQPMAGEFGGLSGRGLGGPGPKAPRAGPSTVSSSRGVGQTDDKLGQLEQENADLKAEVNNLLTYLAASKNVIPVKCNPKALQKLDVRPTTPKT